MAEISERQEKAAQAAVERESEESEVPAHVEPHEDRTKETTQLGFTRMKFDWSGDDASMMNAILSIADDRVLVLFADAFAIMNDLYSIVREPQVTADGEIVEDRHGWPVWEKNSSGRYIEDFGRLGIKDRENFLFQITTQMFDWEQKAADRWAEAMFAKAVWEERFAHVFLDISIEGRKTDEAQTQKARRGSREERYFALFESAISRKTDSLVRSMDRIALRLSQSIT